MSDAVVASLAPIAFAVLIAFLIALCAVRTAIAYAHRRGMYDQPGQRRSHKIPTPRGGGIGIIVSVVITVPTCLLYMQPAWPRTIALALLVAVLLVAWIGWWDDHSPLPALPRFGVQILATALFSVALIASGLSWLWLPLLVLAGAWSINLHNFMDGIDGLLAQQGVFVACGLALLAALADQTALAAGSACVAAACLGFWCYNRSPARIFMGDVGSGSIGLLLFALTAMLWRVETWLLWPALILSSAFVTDATLTLLNRVLGGRRWYTAHREHLYQWIVRRGHTHAAGAAWYGGWNLLVATPLAALAWKRPGLGLIACIVTYAIGAAIWLITKRRMIRRDRYKVHHVDT
ncbi:glycosyltransferase family 4 protein [Dyella caseinilytica]|uniref:Glycosyltransferase family 4 protein n=1 Tax=Dyella caseinilytica TaxID=1849581 RepID=A0ABX7GZP0_9GAMM|nr:glycosyltransferase family 4 protein [Dyella caseinilytica]QRN55426.1 glycosyltransferase family 4 protein [Dyella caseinilytica]GGA01601.1 LPS biosynthesis protein [Dyella caseinilytica]